MTDISKRDLVSRLYDQFHDFVGEKWDDLHENHGYLKREVQAEHLLIDLKAEVAAKGWTVDDAILAAFVKNGGAALQQLDLSELNIVPPPEDEPRTGQQIGQATGSDDGGAENDGHAQGGAPLKSATSTDLARLEGDASGSLNPPGSSGQTATAAQAAGTGGTGETAKPGQPGDQNAAAVAQETGAPPAQAETAAGALAGQEAQQPAQERPQT